MRSLLSIAALLAAAAQSPSQTLVTLRSGEVHEARVENPDSGPRLVTALGTIDVPPKSVASTKDAAGQFAALQAAEDGIHPRNLTAHFALAKLAADRGFWSVARRQLSAVLEIDPDHDAARGVARTWAARFHLSPFEVGKDESVHKEIEAWFGDGARDYAGAAMVAEKSKGIDAGSILHPAIRALKSDKPATRWVAAQILSRLRDKPDRIKPLYEKSLLDRDGIVRVECVRALKVTNDVVFAKLFAKSLGSKSQQIRIAAAEALGELGMTEGAAPIVRLLAGEPPVPRHNYIAEVTQRAYVKDFDVQVAQGAVIADPIVDIVSEGTVLDVAVVSVEIERTVYFEALRRITRQDLGRDLSRWRALVKP